MRTSVTDTPQDVRPVGWSVWRQWLIATGIGGLIGWVLGGVLGFMSAVSLSSELLAVPVVGFVVGCCVGGFQSWVLQWYLPPAIWTSYWRGWFTWTIFGACLACSLAVA